MSNFDQFYADADWRDANQYPGEMASPDRWAWEFLKRNAEFRKESNAALGADNDAYQRHLERWGIARYWPDEFVARNELDAPCTFRPAIAAVRRLRGPAAAGLADWLGSATGTVFAHPARETDMAFVVDLSEPLEPQIDIIRFHAAAQQASMGIKLPLPRHQMKRYASYLRAFDANEAGVNAEEIANVLSLEMKTTPTAKTVRDWIKAARELTYERGYVNIPRITHETAQQRGYLAHK